MGGEVRKAVIRRIAEEKRVPVAVAAHIYDCKSIKAKRALCEREQRAPQQSARK